MQQMVFGLGVGGMVYACVGERFNGCAVLFDTWWIFSRQVSWGMEVRRCWKLMGGSSSPHSHLLWQTAEQVLERGFARDCCSSSSTKLFKTLTKAIVEYLRLKEESKKLCLHFSLVLCSRESQRWSYSSSTSDFLLRFQGDLSRSPSKLLSQDTMFPVQRSQLLLSCILLVALVQLPWSESRPATERTDTGETLHRCQPVKPATAALLI